MPPDFLMPSQIPNTAIFAAHRRAGGVKALADKLGVSRQVVYIWLNQGFVPNERAIQIEKLLGIPRIDLIDPKVKALLTGE